MTAILGAVQPHRIGSIYRTELKRVAHAVTAVGTDERFLLHLATIIAKPSRFGITGRMHIVTFQ